MSSTVKTVFKKGGDRGDRTSYVVDCESGDYLFQEGDLGTEMYIVQEGRVEITKRIEGAEKVLAVLEKGDFFGEMSVLEDIPRTASARALEDTRLVQVNGSTFDHMLRSNPEIAVRMMRKLSRRLRETDLKLARALGREFSNEALEVTAMPEEAAERHLAEQRLVHPDTGMEFGLSAGSESTVGRSDPVTGIAPEIDLGDIDTHRSTSRRHAKIHRRGRKFFLNEEIGTTNGTFINGMRLQTGVPYELKDGDEVQFGLVKMVFRLQK
jgi:CRP-like cAMP-binding protein